MSARWVLISGSLLAHGGLVFALGEIRPEKSFEATAIEMVETRKEQPPPPPAQVDTPPPAPEAPRQKSNNPKSAPSEAPPAEAPASSSPLADLPDFGLELSGGNGGGGLAVGRPPGLAPARPSGPVRKTLEAAPQPTKTAADPCSEGPAKPKLLHLPQPAYTEAARSAGVEGKVRVQITVDESGNIVDVQTLSSLGHGLDEAAVHAARAARFEPAVRCGKPSRSTFTLAIRFSAS
jgi:protein TonB